LLDVANASGDIVLHRVGRASVAHLEERCGTTESRKLIGNDETTRWVEGHFARFSTAGAITVGAG
jgi:hypothetical protein